MRTALIALLAFVASVAAAAVPSQQQKYGGKSSAPVVRRYNPSKPKPADGPLVTIGSHPHMGKAAYNDLRNASITMMKKYPPDKHVYIGLGRDPAPFIAFLQEIGADAVSFPASGSTFAPSAVMDRHVATLIPHEFLNGGKALVLVDQTRSGKTHKGYYPVLKAWLQKNGPMVSVVGVVYSDQSTVTQNHRQLNLDVINTRS